MCSKIQDRKDETEKKLGEEKKKEVVQGSIRKMKHIDEQETLPYMDISSPPEGDMTASQEETEEEPSKTDKKDSKDANETQEEEAKDEEHEAEEETQEDEEEEEDEEDPPEEVLIPEAMVQEIEEPQERWYVWGRSAG